MDQYHFSHFSPSHLDCSHLGSLYSLLGSTGLAQAFTQLSTFVIVCTLCITKAGRGSETQYLVNVDFVRRRFRKQHKMVYFDRLSVGAHIKCNILLDSALENTIKGMLMFSSESLQCFGLCFMFSLCEHVRNHS